MYDVIVKKKKKKISPNHYQHKPGVVVPGTAGGCIPQLPDRALYLSTSSHLLCVNKLLSLPPPPPYRDHQAA